MRNLYFTESIRESIDLIMKKDSKSILFGLGVNDDRGLQGSTKDLYIKYGNDRVFDIPIAEDAMMGFAVGSAIAGSRTIFNHARLDFLLLTFNQLFNVATKYSYMFNGAYKVPLIIRCLVGFGWGAQHSQVLSSILASFPGISVVCPSNPYDAKGLFLQASKINSPVIFIEDFQLYKLSTNVPKKSYYIKFNDYEVLSNGNDLTIITLSSATNIVISYLKKNKSLSIDALSLKSTSDVDYEAIAKSVIKTKKLLFIQNGWMPFGLGANIVRELKLKNINFKYMELGFPFSPTPFSPKLEKIYYLNEDKVKKKIELFIKK